MVQSAQIDLFLTEDSTLEDEDIELPRIIRCSSYLLDQANLEGAFCAGIKVCTDETMCALHEQYMDDPTTTDVMAFPSDEDGYLGDVIVCESVAQREAEKRAHSKKEELQFYILHGLLHLLGYDDQSHEDKMRMLEIQKAALLEEGIKIQL